MDCKELMDKVIRENIKELEAEKEKLNKKILVIAHSSEVTNVNKLKQLASSFSDANKIQTHLYGLLGSLDTRVEAVLSNS